MTFLASNTESGTWSFCHVLQGKNEGAVPGVVRWEGSKAELSQSEKLFATAHSALDQEGALAESCSLQFYAILSIGLRGNWPMLDTWWFAPFVL